MTIVAGACALCVSLCAWRAACPTVLALRATGPVWADRHCTSNPAVVTIVVTLVVVAAAASGRPELALFAAATVYFSLVDLDTHSVPVSHARVAAAMGLALLASTARWTDVSPRQMIAAGAITWITMKSIEVLSRGDLGAGDVTLAPLIGIHAGTLQWTDAVRALACAFVMAGIAAAVVALTRRGGRHTHLPLAPFLFAGTWAVVLR